MITKTEARKRVAELQEQVAQIENEIGPQIMALSEQIMNAEDDAVRIEFQARQDELIAGSTAGADYLSGRLDELVSLFDLDDLVENKSEGE